MCERERVCVSECMYVTKGGRETREGEGCVSECMYVTKGGRETREGEGLCE